MRLSAVGRLLPVGLAVVAVAAAGCGSSGKTHTVSTPSGSRTTTVKTNGSTVAKKSTATKTTASGTVYKAGEFCTASKESTYTAHGFKCVKVNGQYRLEKG